jgi:phosphopantetheinyl transferase (holo-ACP synthase)
LSTWSFEADGPLVGCGIDAELVSRFAGAGVGGAEPWPAIFTAREVEHSRSLASPARGLCAAFCAKEAVLKAVGQPIDYQDCELLLSPGAGEHRLELAARLRREHGVAGGLARVHFAEDPAECVVAVCLVRERSVGREGEP